jgi:hypothetical protein
LKDKEKLKRLENIFSDKIKNCPASIFENRRTMLEEMEKQLQHLISQQRVSNGQSALQEVLKMRKDNSAQ